MTVTVNIADAKVANDPAAVLATFSLGSCIAVSMYDPVGKVGGLLHYQLPTSAMDPQRAQENPLMFADTGLDFLLHEMASCGADVSRIRIKIAGAAQIVDPGGVFNIGKRNHAAIRKMLWQRGYFIDGEDVGGTSPRNVSLRLSDGVVVSESHERTVSL